MRRQWLYFLLWLKSRLGLDCHRPMQALIDSTPSGGEIVLRPGAYRIDATIPSNKSITIRGRS